MKLYNTGTALEAKENPPELSDHFDLSTQPVVLCLWGVGATSQKVVVGSARLAKKMVHNREYEDDRKAPKGLVFLAAEYPKSVIDHCSDIVNLTGMREKKESHIATEYAKKYAADLMTKIFIPHIKKTLSAHPNNIDAASSQLQADFNKLTLFTYSMGSFVAPQLHDALKAHLLETGFNVDQTRNMMRRIHVLSQGDVGIWHHHPREGWDFTSVSFASTADHYVQTVADLPGTQALEGYFSLENSSHTGLILHHLFPEGDVVIQDRKTGNYSLIDFSDIVTHPEDKTVAGHHSRTYITPRLGGVGNLFIPTMIKTAFQNMVNRGNEPTHTAADLLQPSCNSGGYYAQRLEQSPLNRLQTMLDRWPDDWGATLQAHLNKLQPTI